MKKIKILLLIIVVLGSCKSVNQNVRSELNECLDYNIQSQSPIFGSYFKSYDEVYDFFRNVENKLKENKLLQSNDKESYKELFENFFKDSSIENDIKIALGEKLTSDNETINLGIQRFILFTCPEHILSQNDNSSDYLKDLSIRQNFLKKIFYDENPDKNELINGMINNISNDQFQDIIFRIPLIYILLNH
ncbi:hypothetical protein U8527_03100 [Kordia algicida OT-1]|uniref:Lipoprotein n=1 Tax=Kordia algicida OT-1 TaxID=391587 RepID=A9DNX3_9FLAO|nr:hypothetical protein [Kordia algicida]EDP97303.1 hypothetical protein KAOT1_19112 [Kordia algicida OT-1]